VIDPVVEQPMITGSNSSENAMDPVELKNITANTKEINSFSKTVLGFALVTTASPLPTTPNFIRLRKFHSPLIHFWASVSRFSLMNLENVHSQLTTGSRK
jgi:hypothetical protein